MVYLVKGNESEKIDRDILYSILDKDPKRADAYWFVSVNTTDDPYQKNYEVETYGTDYIFRVNLYLGFKVKPSVNIYLRQVVHDLLATGELPKQDKRHSIYGPSDVGSFKFCMIRKMMPRKGILVRQMTCCSGRSTRYAFSEGVRCSGSGWKPPT